MRKFSLRIRFFLCIICAFSSAAALGACGADKSHVSDAAVSSGPIAAYVGDQEIYEDQVSDYTTEFRAANGLEDDAKWKNYLASAGLTGKTWREDVIRQKADRMLIEQKAAELGINADQSFVEEQIAAARARSGVGDDDREWEAYLEAKGFTLESLIESYEYTSIERQVLIHELDLTDEVRSEMCDDYIKTNLADQVVRHYYAFEFDSEDTAKARDQLEELSMLTEEDLAQRFDPNESVEGEAAPVDLGWDFLYDETRIDPNLDLRHAMLPEGSLYKEVLEGSDACRIVFCAEREEFAGVISYNNIRSDSLKGIISDLTMSSQFAALSLKYLEQLELQADVQVVPMPDGLSYDVIQEDESSSQQ